MDNSRAMRIKNMVRLTQHLLSDLKNGCLVGQEIFKTKLNIDYIKIAFDIYYKEVWLPI